MKGCIRFWARSDQNSVSMVTDSSHRVIIVKTASPRFLTPFTQILPTRVCFTNAGINNNNIVGGKCKYQFSLI